jgi:hypothetical protein
MGLVESKKNKGGSGAPRQESVPPHLYTKIVEAMKTENLLASPRVLVPASWLGVLGVLATALLVALGAFYVGKSSAAPVVAEAKQSKFVLLVKADDVPPADGMQQFKEYSAWVQNLKQERWAGGEALKSKAWRLHKSDGEVQVLDYELKTSADELSGYFLFEAADYAEALKIAQTCPHLNYQGTLELREIFQ